MKSESAWPRWAMGTARSWRDIQSLLPETGIDMIDADHKTLLEYAVKINLLAEDVGQGFSEELLDRQRKLLQGLQDYAAFHFDREERFIQAIGAPYLERQRSEHAKITQSLEARAKDFKSGRVSVSPDLRRSIFSWIIDHIKGTDYETFRLANLERAFSSARSWLDVRNIIRATGIDHLDAQHRSLITEIIDLSTHLREKADSETLHAELGRMIAFTQRHFADEEAFMKKYAVNGLAEQIETHAAFSRRLNEFNESHADFSVSPQETEAFIHEMMTWLVDHVNGMDYRDLRSGNWIAIAFETMQHEDIDFLVRATGIPLVDAQHREFIARASKFSDLVTSSKRESPENLVTCFDDLMKYAERHFRDEETLFPEAAALRAQRHRDEHAAILQILGAYKLRLAEGRIGAATAIKSVILGLWVNHTNTTDVDTLGSTVFDGEAERDA